MVKFIGVYTRKLLSMCFKLFQDIFILAFMSIRFTSELIFQFFVKYMLKFNLQNI